MERAAWTPRELADRWQCSERHVRNLINRGELRAFRLGGKLVRVRHEDVERFECRGSEPSGTRMESATETNSTSSRAPLILTYSEPSRRPKHETMRGAAKRKGKTSVEFTSGGEPG